MAAPKKPRIVGPKSDKLWRDALMRAVKRRAGGKGNPQKLERIADACVEEALKGDIPAIKEIGDRLDGKPTQGVELAADDTITKIVREIVRAPNSNG